MKVRMDFVGGPIDGTYEFDEGRKPLKDPNTDAATMQAAIMYELTKGEIGGKTVMASPAAIDRTKRGVRSVGASPHYYQIAERTEEDGVIHLRVKYCTD